MDSKKLKWVYDVITRKKRQQMRFEFALGVSKFEGLIVEVS